MTNTRRWTDQQIDITISVLLRVRVTLSAAIVIVGGVFYLIHNGHAIPENHIFRGEPADLRQISGVFHDVLTLQGRGIIQLGILLLILTPVARVAFSVFAFWQQHDRFYIIVTLIVLAILVHGLLSKG
jgi:uncharacterized membrane protein